MASEAVKQAEAEYCAAMDEREAAFQRLRELNKQQREAETAYHVAEDNLMHVQRRLLDAVYDDKEAYKFLPESARTRQLGDRVADGLMDGVSTPRRVADRPQA